MDETKIETLTLMKALAKRLGFDDGRIGISLSQLDDEGEPIGHKASFIIDMASIPMGPLSVLQRKVYRDIKKDPHITASSLSKKEKVSLRSIEKAIRRLKSGGYIIRLGSRRKGYWLGL